MKTTTAKKLVIWVLVFAIMAGLGFARASGGTTTPTHSPYNTGIGDSINLDVTLIAGAVLYGLGVLFTSSSKAIVAKLSPRIGL